MRNAEIKDLSTKELLEKIEDEKSMLTKLRLNHAISPLDSPMRIRKSRKMIAKLCTEFRARQLKETK